MASKVSGSGGSKVAKATQVAGSNGAPAATTSAKAKPVPAKVVKAVVALGEPHRLAVLGFVAAAAVPVTLADVVGHLTGDAEVATLAINWLKQRGWLTSERVAKGGGGGWSYRLSDAGRERLMVLGS